MSLTGALSNALSGLTANTRAAGIVSANISNALTEGYGRRSLEISPNRIGTHGGVWVDGVIRHGDPAILSDRRLADAGLGLADALQSHAARTERLLGPGDDPSSLTGRITALENALVTAASNPASDQRLAAVSRSAGAIATKLNALSGAVQEARSDADRTITRQVGTINQALADVAQLNDQIERAVRLGRDASTLMDTRQRAVDEIASLVPLRSVARDNGVVALFSTGGTVLLDGSPVTLDYTPNAIIAPHMTQDNGLLSGITIRGRAVDTSPDGPLAGGALAAQFQIRDEETVILQAQLDGLARDLIKRFGAGGPDMTVTAGQPGLFTDGGLDFAPADEVGLSGRIALNALVDADSGTPALLRDGLYAATPGDVGDARLLQGHFDRLGAALPAASAALGTTARSVVGHGAELGSIAASRRVRADTELSFAQSQTLALKELELSQGVDTDRELQLLLQIEQNYAANARVMSVVDDMMQAILAI